MFSLIERRNSSRVEWGARPAYQRGEREQQEKHKKQSMEQSTLQSPLPVDFAQMGRGAWLVQSADVDAVACFISREMREMQDAFTPAIA